LPWGIVPGIMGYPLIEVLHGKPGLFVSEVRADVWLWAARMFKTRALAKEAIDGGKVELNGASCKSSKAVKPGDRVRVSRGIEKLELDVLDVADKRGPAKVAQTLYAETAESVARREAEREQRRLHGESLRPVARPDKQDRRRIQAFKDTFGE
jgi:ribosome-associated heat shock protein Hsp15